MLDKKRVSLKLLSEESYESLFSFEKQNRQWFDKQVNPRPEGYYDYPVFKQFQADLIAEMARREGFYYLAIQDDQQVIGRLNLYDFEHDSAELGYRISEEYAGMGITTYLVSEILRIAQISGFKNIRAGVCPANIASLKVLQRNGFETKPEMQAHQNAERLELIKYL